MKLIPRTEMPVRRLRPPDPAPVGVDAPATGSGAPLFEFADVTLPAARGGVLRRISWTVKANEQWTILGPNGSGKSLLAAAVAGQVLPRAGEIRQGWADDEAGVGWVSPETHRAVLAHESSFYQSRWHSGLAEGELTVRDFLSQDRLEAINPFEVNAAREPRARFLRRRRDALRQLDLSGWWNRRLLHLSHGEMRRLLLARALLQGSRLLVLDEPFVGLDGLHRRQLHRALRNLVQRGQPVLLVTSRPDEIPTTTTHLLLMSDRRVVAQGPKGKLWAHPLIQQLRQASPLASPGRVSGLRATGSRRWGGEVLVDLQRISVRYGRKTLLREVTWQLREGEHWALLGPNGSGKTTLLSLLQGDNPQVYSLAIQLFGRSPDSTHALWLARQQTGWLSPELHLHYPGGWSCLEVVCSGFFDSVGLHQICSGRQKREAGRWLDRLGLGGLRQTAFAELPLGEQRLVLLARAVVKKPRLLVLDEPCHGLDRAHRQALLTVVDDLMRPSAASLILVSHHPRELPDCITHVMQLQGGRVVRQSPVWRTSDLR